MKNQKEKQRQIELEKVREAKRREKAKLRRFVDDEAELGSDNEENDERAKSIDRNDIEEREDDELDGDLDGFVDRGPLAGDAEEIEAGNEAAYEAFQKQLAEDEKAQKR